MFKVMGGVYEIHERVQQVSRDGVCRMSRSERS